MRNVFCLYDDGDHIGCFDSYAEAESYALDPTNRLSRYWDIEEEEFLSICDCGLGYLEHEREYYEQGETTTAEK